MTQLAKALPAFGMRAAFVSLESLPLAFRFLPHAVQHSVSAVNPPVGHYWRLNLGHHLLRRAYEQLMRNDPPLAVIFEDIYLPFHTGLPTLVMLHALLSDNLAHLALSDRALRAARARDSRALMKCEHPVAVVSSAYRDHVNSVVREAGGQARPMEVIPLGIDVDRFANPPAPRPGGELRLVFVGFLEVRKNVLFLVQVAEELRRSYLGPFVLTIGGDGPLRQELLAAIEAAGLASNVRLIGRVRREDVATLLSNEHLMLHPSLKESFSQTLLEGKLAGLVTLATSGLEVPPEFVDTPLPLVPSQWVEAIVRLAPLVIASQANKERLAELQELRSHYSAEAMTVRTLTELGLL
jgi:glycosyltransferase involved in cell wall biosynthesis